MSITADSSNDQVDEQVTEDLRLALLIGTQAAQQLVQRFTEQQREAQRGAEELTRQFNAELAAHKAIALAATERVGDARWWNDTSPRDLAHAWEVAKVWQGRDPELDTRLQAFREGLGDRFRGHRPRQPHPAGPDRPRWLHGGLAGASGIPAG